MKLNYKPMSLTKSCALSLVLLSPAVFAAPIVGTLEMTGGYSITGATATTNTHIDFYSLAGDDKFTVTGGSGDFELAFGPGYGQVGTITDLNLDLSGSPVCVDCTVIDFYTVGDFSFDLLSIEVTQNDANNLNLAGMGSFSNEVAGFDDTAGAWSFTSDHTGAGVFTWSSSTVSVPEPGTAALLLAGLAGLVTARRHQS